MFAISTDGHTLFCRFPWGDVAATANYHGDPWLCAHLRACPETWLDLFKFTVPRDDRRWDAERKLWELTWHGFDILGRECGAFVAPLPQAVLDVRFPAHQVAPERVPARYAYTG